MVAREEDSRADAADDHPAQAGGVRAADHLDVAAGEDDAGADPGAARGGADDSGRRGDEQGRPLLPDDDTP